MDRNYHKWYSENQGREMELLIFGDRGARVIVFPTRDGAFYDYENWGMVGALAEKIEQGFIQIICVDGNDRESLYADWLPVEERIARHERYEKYILDEVLPFTEKQNPKSFLIAHGCSLGAYNAVNITFRHPEVFGKVVALSGRYDLTRSIGGYPDLFNGYTDDRVYFNNPSYFVPNIEDDQLLDKLRKLEVTLAVGEQDSFCQNNQEFSHVLTEKNIPHALYIWDGEAHGPRHWRQMVTEYL